MAPNRLNLKDADLFAVMLRREAPEKLASYTDKELCLFYKVWFNSYASPSDKLAQFIKYCQEQP